MPLAINLKSKERLIVNGVVLENSGTAAKLLIHNNAAVLRERDIITEADANTPARRIYFAIQCRYLFPGKDAAASPLLYQLLQELETSAPSTARLTREIRANLEQGALYHALRSAKQLIAREQAIVDGFADTEPPHGTAAR
jgi:flagellar protein FlbT